MIRRITIALPLLALALAGTAAGAAPHPGNQGQSWQDIARLPPITGLYESALDRMAREVAAIERIDRDAAIGILTKSLRKAA